MGKEKKKKNKSSKHKKHKVSRKPSSSDDSSSSSENEWVEIGSKPSKPTPLPAIKEIEPTVVKSERDDWMNNPALFACVTRGEIRQDKSKKKNERSEEEKYMLDKLGQTERELNPYWKDGGTGLPEEKPTSTETLQQAEVTVGDQGVAWLRKALQRAKEQAAEQRRPLEQVVAERWGSLAKLESMIAAAEEREQYPSRSGRHSQTNSKDFRNKLTRSEDSRREQRRNNDENEKKPSTKSQFSKPQSSDESSGERYERRNKQRSREENDRSHRGNDERNREKSKYRKEYERNRKPFSKPIDSSDDSSDEKYRKDKKKSSRRKRYSSTSSSSSSSSNQETKRKNSSRRKEFSKPRNSSSEDESRSYKRDDKYDKRKEMRSEEKKKDSKRTFAIPRHESDEEYKDRDKYKHESRKSYSSSGWRKKTEKEISKSKVDKDKSSNVEDIKYVEEKTSEEDVQQYDEKEKSPVKVEEKVLTDKEMNDLAAKLVKAELLNNQELVNELKAKLERAREVKASKPKQPEVKEEVVILTHTDARGFTRPVSLGEYQEPRGGRRKGNKVETHAGGKRTKYFADDDKYNLQEMFQREKLSTVEDSNEVFAKLASKGVGRDDSARDMDDVFEETARVEESEGRKQRRDRDQAIQESKRVAKTLDNCQWCLESKEMLKHLIVAIGSKCYLCVPPYQSLTENHCLIVPSCHSACATQLDEDVWAEMQDFRKSLVQMFLSQDEDVVFFENARYLNKFPHMVLNCVPMPKETGDLAPIYFKKAIQECEMEWSNNKKLVELKGKGVRRAVPKGLPYFAVDFGADSGFAHVIEDEKLFPHNFAQEIIGGMLDLDHSVWRKQKRQTFEDQSKKVIKLTKLWAPFDFLKNK